MNKGRWLSLIAVMALLLGALPLSGSVVHAEDSRTFPETGHTVSGLFLDYWNTHGGLAQQGYPISEQIQEVSDTDGKTYTMQYFERAVFEMHPENAAPFNVLLSLLGTAAYNQKYSGNAPGQHANTDNPRMFTETGKTIGGAFRKYWEGHGGLAQQGFPISDEFQEVSSTDGKTYTVQYFQRAVFEYHPEFANTANEVLLSLLGVFFYNQKHGGGTQPTPMPTSVTAPTPTAVPQPVGSTGQVLFFNGSGAGQPALLDSKGSIFMQTPFQHSTPDWTSAVSIGGGYMLFYKLAAGGRTGRLDPDGTYRDLKVGIPFSGGWTNVVAVGSSMVVFFNNASKALEIGRINVDGSYSQLKTTTMPLPYAQMLGSTDGHLYFYLDSPQLDTFVHEMTAVVDAQGNLTNMVPVTSRARVDRNWLPETWLDNKHVFFYNPVSGQIEVRELQADGLLKAGTPQDFGKGWTSFAAAINDIFVAYRLDTGGASTLTFTPDFKVSALKEFSGASALSKGWTILTSIK